MKKDYYIKQVADVHTGKEGYSIFIKSDIPKVFFKVFIDPQCHYWPSISFWNSSYAFFEGKGRDLRSLSKVFEI